MIESYFLGPLWFWSKKHLICIENTGCTEKSKTHWNRKYHCNESVKRYELVQAGKLGLLLFFIPIHRPIPVPLSSAPFLFLFFIHRTLELLLTFLFVAIICHPLTFHNLNQTWLTWSVDDSVVILFFCDPILIEDGHQYQE